MSRFKDHGGRITPGRHIEAQHEVIDLSDSVRVYTDAQKAALEAQGKDTNQFIRITPTDSEEQQ